jgi:hypothetical protein
LKAGAISARCSTTRSPLTIVKKELRKTIGLVWLDGQKPRPPHDEGRFIRPATDPRPPVGSAISRADDGKGRAYGSQAGGEVNDATSSKKSQNIEMQKLSL